MTFWLPSPLQRPTAARWPGCSQKRATVRFAASSNWWKPEIPKPCCCWENSTSRSPHLPRDPLRAAMLYVRASWMELPLALRLLAPLLASAEMRDRLYSAAYASNTDAQYVLAALRALDLDRRLSPSQARELLQRAIEAGSTDALVQLGIWYAGGRLLEQSTERAARCWEDAAKAGSREGAIRYAATVLARGDDAQRREALALLDSAALDGCLVANVMIARSNETGLGRSPRPGVAAHLYRDAAIRGSRIAYGALRAMYERLRPEDEVFRIPAR